MCTKPIFELPLAIWIENTHQAKTLLTRLKELGFTWNGGNKIDLTVDLRACINFYIVISQLNLIFKRENNYLHCGSHTSEKFRYDLENCHIIDVNDLEDYLVNQPENNNTELPNQSDDSDNQTVTLFYSKENAHPHLEIILEYYTNFKNIEKVLWQPKINGYTWAECGNRIAFKPDNNYKLVYKTNYQLVIDDKIVVAKSYEKDILIEKMNKIKGLLDEDVSITILGEDQ